MSMTQTRTPGAQADAGHSDAPQAFVIGAGLAGLAAGLGLAEAGWRVRLFEAAPRAGGRCRSFRDDRLSMQIDNGNHFIMSGNDAALGFLARVGAKDALIGPREALYPFVDLANGRRYCVKPGRARTPLWLFHPEHGAPGAGFPDYFEVARFFLASEGDRVSDVIRRRGAMWRAFWEPMTAAVLNAAPENSQARLLAPVLTRTFLRGGDYCRPLIARTGLGDAFVTPTLARIGEKGGEIRFGARLKALEFDAERVRALIFADARIEPGPRDAIVLAVPPARAGELVPGLVPPEDGETILNAHFRLDSEPPPLPGGSHLMGVIGAATQWIAVRGVHVSLTISAAGALADEDEETLLPTLWAETRRALALPPETPWAAGRIIREKRATFLPDPANVRRRAPARTAWRNLVLAGDWTATGLPATIEGAIVSGNTAARLVTRIQ